MPPAHPGPEQAGPEPRQRRIEWSRATRIIATRYPPIDLFEQLSSDTAIWEALIAAESLVNPRLRDEVGEIHLVPPEEQVAGPGASYVMAAFTHLNPKGSRFSDGSYGVYYAARALETALRETAYHFGRFATDSADGPRYEDMRVLTGRIADRFHDAASLGKAARAAILNSESYAASQTLGARLREAGSNGIIYPSVRHAGGVCAAAFRPKAVGVPVQTNHLKFHWDGTRVVRYFDYERDGWIALDA